MNTEIESLVLLPFHVATSGLPSPLKSPTARLWVSSPPVGNITARHSSLFGCALWQEFPSRPAVVLARLVQLQQQRHHEIEHARALEAAAVDRPESHGLN